MEILKCIAETIIGYHNINTENVGVVDVVDNFHSFGPKKEVENLIIL